FRFVAFVGVKKEDQLAHDRLSYTAQDLFSPTAFPRIKLDNYVEYFLEEFRPYKKGELDTFGAKDRSGIPRDQDMELLREGDYMDVYFFSPPTRVLGWFEIVRTVDGKIPSRENLKWLECFAQVAGRIAYEMERRKR
ncbi:MAG TPA: hypothetical protein VMW02_02390, partial [Thermoplasmata archaeon]|nr:hypothetical protein [Thermoplasmata archaeon]